MNINAEVQKRMREEHEAKYTALCEKFGVRWTSKSPRFVGETPLSLAAKYKADRYLNNVPLRLWDRLACAFLAYNQGCGLSLAEAVCMQKHAAVEMLRREGLIEE